MSRPRDAEPASAPAGGGRRPLWRRLARLLGVALGGAPIAALAFVAWPLPPDLLGRGELASLRLLDREGGLLREVRSRVDGRGQPLPPDAPIPEHLRLAFLAAEDARFYRHTGVDPLAICRAAVQNVRAGRIVSGASTITQQLARGLSPRPRTLPGKAAEALWALRLEAHLPKERILRAYLDRVPLGYATHGVEAAAHLYFGRSAATLSVGQAALLAGMASSPSRFDPFRHEGRARARMGWVLDRMVALGMISAERARLEREASLDLVRPAATFRAPHFTTQLLHDLDALGLDGAVEVRTTLDPALQARVERWVREELAALAGHDISQAAAVAIDNATGDVLAYVGSSSFFDHRQGGQNDGVRALRQPGSALKPFAYGLGLASGWTPATILADVETHLSTPSGAWVPKNYDRRVHGPVRLRAALANSYNVPAVRLTDELGADRVLEVLRDAGFASLDADASHYGAGIVLGNGDTTLWELARSFVGLARGGVVGPLRTVLGATDPTGAPLVAAPELEPRRFLPADAVALLTDLLSDEGARGPAFGMDNALRLPFPVAAKTGTSRAYVDNWTVGFTAERTVAVWVGNFDGRPMRRVSGITGAGPLFRRIMEGAMEGVAPAPLVDRSRFAAAAICPLSGELASPRCPHRVEERFLPGTEPTASCSMHREEDGRVFVDPGPRFLLWAQAEGFDSRGEVVGHGAGELILPQDGDEYLLDPSLPAEDQSIPVRVVPPAGVDRIWLRTSDGARVTLEAPFSTRLPAVRGEHEVQLWVPGADAPWATARFRIR